MNAFEEIVTGALALLVKLDWNQRGNRLTPSFDYDAVASVGHGLEEFAELAADFEVTPDLFEAIFGLPP